MTDEERKERQRQYNRHWRAAHIEELKEYQKKWRDSHPEKTRKYHKNYNKNNSEAVRAYCRRRYAENPQKHRDRARRDAIKNWATTTLRKARQHSSARERNGQHCPCTIDKTYLQALWDRQEGRCFWTHVPMTHEFTDLWIVSIDRLDNTKGYEDGNVVLCGSWINRARGILTVLQFKEFLQQVVTGLTG